MKERFYTNETNLYFRGWAVYDRTMATDVEGPRPAGLFFSRRTARKVARLLNKAEHVGVPVVEQHRGRGR